MNGILWKNGTEIMQHVLKNAVNFLDAKIYKVKHGVYFQHAFAYTNVGRIKVNAALRRAKSLKHHF